VALPPPPPPPPPLFFIANSNFNVKTKKNS